MAGQHRPAGKGALATPSIEVILPKLNSTERKQQDQTVLAAVQKNLAATGTNAAETAKAAWLVSAKAEDAQALAAQKLRQLLHAYAVTTYGDTDDVRSEWGMPPLKATIRTAASKAAAAAKAKATREAHKAAMEGTNGTAPSASTGSSVVNGASATSAKS
jgi:hypothetical protein